MAAGRSANPNLADHLSNQSRATIHVVAWQYANWLS